MHPSLELSPNVHPLSNWWDVQVFLLLTFEHTLHLFSSASIVDFEQVNIRWPGFENNHNQVIFSLVAGLRSEYAGVISNSSTSKLVIGPKVTLDTVKWSISCIITFSANIYLFKVNNKSSRKKREICSKLTATIKTIWRRHRRCSVVFIANFEHISNSFFNISVVELRTCLCVGFWYPNDIKYDKRYK